MPKWIRSFAIVPLPGVEAEPFEQALRERVVPAVNTGATRGGEVESKALYRTSHGQYRWQVDVSTVGGQVGDPPGFVDSHFARALEELASVGVVYATDDLVEVAMPASE